MCLTAGCNPINQKPILIPPSKEEKRNGTLVYFLCLCVCWWLFDDGGIHPVDFLASTIVQYDPVINCYDLVHPSFIRSIHSTT